MLQRRPGRKLLYPAGLISLAILPLFGYHFYCSNYPIQNLKCMEVIYWNGKITPDFASPLPLIANTRFNRITLNGSKDDEIKLSYSQVAIRELIHSDNYKMGFEFTFEETASYSSLVKLIDICEIEGATRYLNHEDNFYVFNSKPKVKTDLSSGTYLGICGTSLLYRNLNKESSALKIQMKINWLFIVLSGTLFSMLVVLQIRFLLSLRLKGS